jgi:hypothetical protein
MHTLRKWLQDILSKTVSAALAKIIADAILGAVPLVLLLVFLKDWTWRAIQAIGQFLIADIPVWSVVGSLVLVGISYGTFKWLKKPKYFFLDAAFAAWRVEKKTGEVEPEPYCPKHHAQLVFELDGYFCPMDGATEKFPNQNIIESARSVARSIAKGYVRRELRQ